jgi:DNA-binding transcriptional MerR regulator
MNNFDSDWSIQSLVAETGMSSRTLRHYDAIGLLKPSRLGSNGMRYYNQTAVLRLQRILVLKELGLGLAEIAKAIESTDDIETVLNRQIELLAKQRERIQKQIETLETTLLTIQEGGSVMPEIAFDGFENDPYASEAEQRWPYNYAESRRRLGRLSADEQRALFEQGPAITQALADVMLAGHDVQSPEAQAVIAKHYAWICSFWTPNREAYIGLGEMYVADERFKAHYEKFAAGLDVFALDAMRQYAFANLA